MAKPEEKKLARELRKKGYSIKNIAKKIKVSPSTVSLWCKDIILTSDQILNLQRLSTDPNYGKRLENSLRQRKKKEKKIKRLRSKGIEKVGKLSNRDLFIAGICLYWAEGFKKDSRVGFANSDPKMINFFVLWIKNAFKIKAKDLTATLTINASHKHRTNEILKYWSTQTQIPIPNFGKTFYQNSSWKKQYPNPQNYHGVLRIRVKKSIDILREINGYIEGVKEAVT